MTKPIKKDRLESWSKDFDKLLKDPAGLNAFSEFLRKQYSQENINFWVSCENFKLSNESQRYKYAAEIFDRFFASGCIEPINIDSTVRQNIAENIKGQNVSDFMYNQAQYQIFHLMKYDCYPRFLKSDEYTKCWDALDKCAGLPETREPYMKLTDGGPNWFFTLAKASSSIAHPQKIDHSDKKQARKTCLPWKTRFIVGVGGCRKWANTKDDDSTGDLECSQSSSEPSRTLSHFGSKRKQDWKFNKQHSFHAEVAHSAPCVNSKKLSKSISPNSETQTAKNSDFSTYQADSVYIPNTDAIKGDILAPTCFKNSQQMPKGILKTTSVRHATPSQAPSVCAALGQAEVAPAEVNFRQIHTGTVNSCRLVLPGGTILLTLMPKNDISLDTWLRCLAKQHNFSYTDFVPLDENTKEMLNVQAKAADVIQNRSLTFRRKINFLVALTCDWPEKVAYEIRFFAVQVPYNRPIEKIVGEILTNLGQISNATKFLPIVLKTTSKNCVCEILSLNSIADYASNKILLILPHSLKESFLLVLSLNRPLVPNMKNPIEKLLSIRRSSLINGQSVTFCEILPDDLPADPLINILELAIQESTKIMLLCLKYHELSHLYENYAANGKDTTDLLDNRLMFSDFLKFFNKHWQYKRLGRSLGNLFSACDAPTNFVEFSQISDQSFASQLLILNLLANSNKSNLVLPRASISMPVEGKVRSNFSLPAACSAKTILITSSCGEEDSQISTIFKPQIEYTLSPTVSQKLQEFLARSTRSLADDSLSQQTPAVPSSDGDYTLKSGDLAKFLEMRRFLLCKKFSQNNVDYV